jgi:hypothetical protein
MAPSTPPLQFDHLPGQEIPTKHKEAIRQLYGFAKIPIWRLEKQYKLSYTTICRILTYDEPERARPSRIGRPQKLTDTKVNEIIEYCSENWEQRALNYEALVIELKLDCTASTL